MNLSKKQVETLQAIHANGMCDAYELAESLSLSVSGTRSRVRTLVALGLVEVDPGYVHGACDAWSLTSDGRKSAKRGVETWALDQGRVFSKLKFAKLDGNDLEQCPEGDVVFNGEVIGTWNPEAINTNRTSCERVNRVTGYSVSLFTNPATNEGIDVSLELNRIGVTYGKGFLAQDRVRWDHANLENASQCRTRLKSKLAKLVVVMFATKEGVA